MSQRQKIFLFAVIFFIVITLVKSFATEKKPEEIRYSEAQNMITQETIEKVELAKNAGRIYLYEKNQKKSTYYAIIPSIDSFMEFMERSSDVELEVTELSQISTLVTSLFSSLLTIGSLIFIYIFMLKKLTPGSNDKIEPVDTSNCSFDNVAGIDEELYEVEEVVEILKNPKKYTEMGIKVPKGILLYGEPGTGKTLIAKAIAGEAKVPFFNCSGSEFENVYVGLGAAKIRKLFKAAKEQAPSIIFIDEIDAVAQNRYQSKSYSEQTLNQLLGEIDGFSESTNVIVIAATNHIEVLDPALTRPGRFDRKIEIPLPDRKGRKEILEVHARDKKFGTDKDQLLEELAGKTAGMSGATLENLLNEASIEAVRNGRQTVTREDMDEAFIKVILGISKGDAEVTTQEMVLTAVHEAGHAVVSRIFRKSIMINEVSIIPRGKAGGYTLFSDRDYRMLSKADLFYDIAVSLGGAAAEEVFLKTTSIGASSDYQKASELAHRMVYRYAMNSGDSKLVKLYGEDYYNAELEKKMIESVDETVTKAYREALTTIEEHSHVVTLIVKKLAKKPTLKSEDLEAVFVECGV